MYFLYNVCAEPSMTPIFNIVGVVINVIWIGIPILLIILGMIDLGKAVVASKEDEVKKATKAFGKRFLYAVAVFLVVWLVRFALTTVTSIADDEDIKYNNDSWEACWCRITNGSNADGSCKVSE